MEITIRLATTGDALGIAAIYSPVVRDTPASFETEPPDAEEMARRIAATLPTWPWLVASSAGRLTGYAYAGRHRARPAYRWSVETSVYVAAEARGRGIGRSLYAALFAVLRAQGFANAYAGVTVPNEASLTLHRAVGFEEVGVYRRVGYKQGRWHDVWWGQLDLAPERVGEPLSLRTVENLRAEEWARLFGGSP